MLQILTRETVFKGALQRRMKRLTENDRIPARVKESMLLTLESGRIPRAQFAEGFDLSQHFRAGARDGHVAEFIGTGDFDAQWVARQRYEIDAGRDEEPLLYPAIYTVESDPNLPQIIPIYTLGTTGIVFEEVTEGGEVKFASVGEGSKNVTIRHYAVGIQYSEDLFIYNYLFRMAMLERNFGIAHNALLNHVHFNPILTYGYGAVSYSHPCGW